MSAVLPDLWQEKFKNCRMENTTFLHPKKGCHLNFQEENDIVIYMVSFLGSLAVLPGNIISALFIDKIGRIRLIGEIYKKCPNSTMTFVWVLFRVSLLINERATSRLCFSCFIFTFLHKTQLAWL